MKKLVERMKLLTIFKARLVDARPGENGWEADDWRRDLVGTVGILMVCESEENSDAHGIIYYGYDRGYKRHELQTKGELSLLDDKRLMIRSESQFTFETDTAAFNKIPREKWDELIAPDWRFDGDNRIVYAGPERTDEEAREIAEIAVLREKEMRDE